MCPSWQPSKCATSDVIGRSLWPSQDGQFGDYHDCVETKHSRLLALTQLLITYRLSRKYGDAAPLPFAPPVAALSRMPVAPFTPHAAFTQLAALTPLDVRPDL